MVFLRFNENGSVRHISSKMAEVESIIASANYYLDAVAGLYDPGSAFQRIQADRYVAEAVLSIGNEIIDDVHIASTLQKVSKKRVSIFFKKYSILIEGVHLLADRTTDTNKYLTNTIKHLSGGE